VPALELLALVLAIPGALAALHDLFARAPARSRAARPRTTELDITVRLRVRRI